MDPPPTFFLWSPHLIVLSQRGVRSAVVMSYRMGVIRPPCGFTTFAGVPSQEVMSSLTLSAFEPKHVGPSWNPSPSTLNRFS